MARIPEDVESYGVISGDEEEIEEEEEDELEGGGGGGGEEEEGSLSRSRSLVWKWCGSDYPRREIVFLAQVLAVYTVVIASIYNLTVDTGHKELWIALLSSALGYMLPCPALDASKTSRSIDA